MDTTLHELLVLLFNRAVSDTGLVIFCGLYVRRVGLPLLLATITTVAGAAKILGISITRVYQLIRKGRLAAHKHGGTWLVPVASIEALQEQRSQRDWWRSATLTTQHQHSD